MALALVLALALFGAEPPIAAVDQPSGPPMPAADAAPSAAGQTSADPASASKFPTREQVEDMIPDGAPKDDYGFVAWCHGALAGQVELDPIVEKDMDAIEGKAKAAARKADDEVIAREHKRYLALYEKALTAAETASPVAIHQKGVEAELLGYRMWGPTRNKAPIWRMVDWGNWEVPPRCEKAAKRLYDNASLFGAALKSEGPSAGAADPAPSPAEPPAAAQDPAASTPPAGTPPAPK